MKKGRILLGVALSLGLVFSAQARTGHDHEKDYFGSVMTILHSHIDALVRLTETRSRFSDNVVRHAVAIHRTMGLFDHMDWTPERLARLNLPREGDTPKVEQFNAFAVEARDSSKNLVRAAKRWLADGNRPEFMSALNRMTGSCNQCHEQLRDRSAPILMSFKLEE